MNIHLGPGGERSRWVFTLAAVAVFVIPSARGAHLAAQTIPVALEIQVGAARPLGEFEKLDPGPSILTGVELVVAIHPRVAAYGGYRSFEFECAGEQCRPLGPVDHLTETGWTVGAELGFPVRDALRPHVRLGTVAHSLEFGGSDVAGLGLELGGGMDIQVGRTLSVTPRLRYHRWGADQFPAEGGATSTGGVTIQQVTVSIGLRFAPFAAG